MVAIPTGIISAGFVEYYSKIKSGTYSQRNDDFVVMDLGEGHEFVGSKLSEITMPTGIYPAVVMRGEDLFTPYEELKLQPGDSLLLATTSAKEVEADICEITLEENHHWIGKRIKEIDISRRAYVIMVRRGEKTIRPMGDTLLLQGDVIVLLDRR